MRNEIRNHPDLNSNNNNKQKYYPFSLSWQILKTLYKLVIFFSLFFSQKIDFDSFGDSVHEMTKLFSGKNQKKKNLKCHHSAELFSQHTER